MAKRVTVKQLVAGDNTVSVISNQLRINQEMQADGEIKVIQLEKITANKFNPRSISFSRQDVFDLAQGRDAYLETLDDDQLKNQLTELLSLADNIDQSGLMQPIVVTDHPDMAGSFMVVAGERRYWAHILLGRVAIRCVYRKTDEREHRSLSIAENLARNDLTLREKVAGLKSLVDLDDRFLKVDHVMRLFGVRKTTAYQLIKSVKDDGIYDAVQSGEITQFREIDSFGTEKYDQDFPTVGKIDIIEQPDIERKVSDGRKKSLTLNGKQVENLAILLGIEYNATTINEDIMALLR